MPRRKRLSNKDAIHILANDDVFITGVANAMRLAYAAQKRSLQPTYRKANGQNQPSNLS